MKLNQQMPHKNEPSTSSPQPLKTPPPKEKTSPRRCISMPTGVEDSVIPSVSKCRRQNGVPGQLTGRCFHSEMCMPPHISSSAETQQIIHHQEICTVNARMSPFFRDQRKLRQSPHFELPRYRVRSPTKGSAQKPADQSGKANLNRGKLA